MGILLLGAKIIKLLISWGGFVEIDINPDKCVMCNKSINNYSRFNYFCIDCFVAFNQKNLLNDYFIDKYAGGVVE